MAVLCRGWRRRISIVVIIVVVVVVGAPSNLGLTWVGTGVRLWLRFRSFMGTGKVNHPFFLRALVLLLAILLLSPISTQPVRSISQKITSKASALQATWKAM